MLVANFGGQWRGLARVSRLVGRHVRADGAECSRSLDLAESVASTRATRGPTEFRASFRSIFLGGQSGLGACPCAPLTPPAPPYPPRRTLAAASVHDFSEAAVNTLFPLRMCQLVRGTREPAIRSTSCFFTSCLVIYIIARVIALLWHNPSSFLLKPLSQAHSSPLGNPNRTILGL
jgi:hypothetical protein